MIHVLARIAFKADAADQARDILQKLMTQSRREPGCVSYELYRQAKHRHIFHTVEKWQNQSAADAHLLAPHVAAAIAAAGPLFAAAPEIESYELIDPSTAL